MADKIYLSIEQVIKDCGSVCDQIIGLAGMEKHGLVNLVVVQTGGAFPGSIIEKMLQERGYDVKRYDIQTNRYHGTNHEGTQFDWVRELLPDEKRSLASSMSIGIPTLIVDELVQDGTTLQTITAYVNGIRSMFPDLPMDNVRVYRGVLHVKPDYSDNGHSLCELDFYAQVFNRTEEGKSPWLVYQYKPDANHPDRFPALQSNYYDKLKEQGLMIHFGK